MDHPARHILGLPLAAFAVMMIYDGIRRVRSGGDVHAMVVGLAEISVPASFLLGFLLAALGAHSPPPPI